MKPLEYANQFKRLMRISGLTVTCVAEKISQPPQFVQDYLDLLKLNPEIQQLVNDGVLSIHTILTGDFAPSDS